MNLHGGRVALELRNAFSWIKYLEDFQRDFGAQSFRIDKMAKNVVDKIKKHCEMSKDIHGGHGEGLAEKYKIAKKDMGARPIRDMRLTGNLLNHLTFKIEPRLEGGVICTVYFTGKKEPIVAAVHNYGMISGPRKARFKQKQFEFFGLNAAEIKQTLDDMENEVADYINNYKEK